MTGKAAEKITDIHWKYVWLGYGISLLGTLVLGSIAYVAYKNVWWIALGSAVSLYAGGFFAARQAKSSRALDGAYLAAIYYLTVLLALFVGMMTELLPDTLPGLPIGDSTFYFSWPLGQLLAATLGSLTGGRGRARVMQKSREKVDE